MMLIVIVLDLSYGTYNGRPTLKNQNILNCKYVLYFENKHNGMERLLTGTQPVVAIQRSINFSITFANQDCNASHQIWVYILYVLS